MIKENTVFNDSEVIILGSSGGRTDYIINNLMLLEGTKNVTMITENEEIYYRDEPFVIENREEARVSFISLDDTIMNMTLKGFKYSIENKLIKRNTSQLVSNEVISKKAEVLFDKGKMLVILEKTL
jgi:thiamine pyrophosphokinase